MKQKFTEEKFVDWPHLKKKVSVRELDGDIL